MTAPHPQAAPPLRIHAWRVGREWSAWHLFAAKRTGPLCGTMVPDRASLCELTERSAVLSLETLCKSCLRMYAELPAALVGTL